MRRIAALALVALLVAFALPGCGGGEESPSPGGDQTTPTTTSEGRYGY
jgi:hypothetical protein